MLHHHHHHAFGNKLLFKYRFYVKSFGHDLKDLHHHNWNCCLSHNLQVNLQSLSIQHFHMPSSNS